MASFIPHRGPGEPGEEAGCVSTMFFGFLLATLFVAAYGGRLRRLAASAFAHHIDHSMDGK
jgi:hypothetical protein